MRRRRGRGYVKVHSFLYTIWFILLCGIPTGIFAAPAQKPNIIFILVDDLGFGDVGVFFQNSRRTGNVRSEPWHLTPRLDRMAAEGIQLRDHYCPAPVCAPSRASLLLGVHQGHANVRDNQFDKALENNHTLATVLKGAGYATVCIGKWGLQGKRDDSLPNKWPAHPLNRGFDEYFGYISHNAGHFHYPKEDEQLLLDGSVDVADQFDHCYTTDLFTARAKKWIVEQRQKQPQQPFFLYLSYDTPHAKLQLPPAPYPAGAGLKGGLQWLGTPGRMITTATGTPDSFTHPDYANATWDHDSNSATPEQSWPDVYKRYATDVRRIDDCVGDLLELLKDLTIDNDTLVVFTSDNGPSKESYLKQDYSPAFFNSFGPYDGIKRDCWEGGIRVGALVRWPGKISENRVSREPSQFHDWLPTFAEVAGVPTPARSDGVSLLPTLTTQGTQAPSRVYVEYFQNEKTPPYPEFGAKHRGRVRQQMQALRLGDFMGVRYQITNHIAPFEVYNVVTDPHQATNLATQSSFDPLQEQMHKTVLRLRRPNAQSKRPYDAEPVPGVELSNLVQGVEWHAYAVNIPWLPKFEEMKSSTSGAAGDFRLKRQDDSTGLLFTGYIQAPADGEYTFYLESGSKALLRLHEATVIDADFGYKSGSELKAIIPLKAGWHPFRLYTSGGGSSSGFKLQWSSSNISKQEIPTGALFRSTAQTPTINIKS